MSGNYYAMAPADIIDADATDDIHCVLTSCKWLIRHRGMHKVRFEVDGLLIASNRWSSQQLISTASTNLFHEFFHLVSICISYLRKSEFNLPLNINQFFHETFLPWGIEMKIWNYRSCGNLKFRKSTGIWNKISTPPWDMCRNADSEVPEYFTYSRSSSILEESRGNLFSFDTLPNVLGTSARFAGLKREEKGRGDLISERGTRKKARIARYPKAQIISQLYCLCRK